MNWKRGLFRVWLVAALLWAFLCVAVNWSVIAADISCLLGTAPADLFCRFRPHGGLEDPRFWMVLAMPPIAALLGGYTLLWMARGFRR